MRVILLMIIFALNHHANSQVQITKMQNFIDIRKEIHSLAENSGQEIQTSKYVKDILKQLGVIKFHDDFSMHSFIAEIDSREPGPVILFRSELDALPIQENNSFLHVSKNPGVSHKCGHDGHTTILIQLAAALMAKPLKNGKVLLFFQSAEENGAGAKAAVESGIFRQFNIDYVFACHNWPGLPMGKIVAKEGPITASVESLVVELTGRTSHASQPEQGINPALATAELISYFDSLNLPDKSSDRFFLATPIHIFMGEKAYGTSAGKASIGYTLRTWDNQYLKIIKSKIEEKLTQTAQKHQLQLNIKWTESFYANTNNKDAVQIIKDAAKANQIEYEDITAPFEGGEDFGYITDQYKGAMFMIGSGEKCPPLHSDTYDFPDQLLETGSKMFLSLIKIINGG